MGFVIVPDSLSDTIYEKVDAALALCPDASPDREVYYQELLSFYNEHGYIPEFTLRKSTPLVSRELVSGLDRIEIAVDRIRRNHD